MKNIDAMKNELIIFLMNGIRRMDAAELYDFVSDLESNLDSYRKQDADGNDIRIELPDSVYTCRKCGEKGCSYQDTENYACLEAFIQYCEEEAEQPVHTDEMDGVERNYIVAISEKAFKLVSVRADSSDKAIASISEKYKQGDLVLDSEDFAGVEFDAELEEPELEREVGCR